MIWWWLSSPAGIKEPLRACCGAGGPYNYNVWQQCGDPGVIPCGNPESYLSWDGIHGTEALHRAVAQGWLQGPYNILPIFSNCPSYLLQLKNEVIFDQWPLQQKQERDRTSQQMMGRIECIIQCMAFIFQYISVHMKNHGPYDYCICKVISIDKINIVSFKGPMVSPHCERKHSASFSMASWITGRSF